MPKKVVVLSPEEEDCETIKRIVSSHDRKREYEIIKAENFDDAKRLMPQASVIVCDACLPEGNWQRVLEMAQDPEEKAHPLVIICSKKADHRLWSEALSLGARDVLEKPFRDEEVFRVITDAVKKQEQQ